MTQQAPQRVRPRPQFRFVDVNRINRLSPNLVRVTFAGPELEGFTPHGPAEHIRVWFPGPGEDRPHIPEWGQNGFVLAEGQERPVNRVYTPRRFDPDALELDVDFVLHEGTSGPGSSWAMNAKAGDTVVVTGPGGPYRVDETADWFVIAGDHAALPAIGTILETLPSKATAHVYVEVPGAEDEIRLESRAPFDVAWLHSRRGSSAGSVLAETLKDLEFPAGDGRIFVACEATIMREVKKHLLFERNLQRGHIHTHGYWQTGEENHPDHDLGQEI